VLPLGARVRELGDDPRAIERLQRLREQRQQLPTPLSR
jgi:hypothetical protein